MKISVNWLKQFTEIKDDPKKLLELIGSQLGEVENVQMLNEKYRGIIVVKVVSCVKHPNADKLSLCKIDDGRKVQDIERDKDGLIQVVCGASNVKADMFAVWLPPGNVVPATFSKDPLILEIREIRGQISNGMLASPSELGISEDHEGILEIDKAEAGESFMDKFLLDDCVFEIENKMFTHRPDCFGMLGIAREVAGIKHQQFTSPKWYTENVEITSDNDDLELNVENEIGEEVPRLSAVALSDIKIGPSPLWLEVALSKLGLKSINNIVDMTNFYMFITGQPLHAYDYDKVAKLSKSGAVIKTRYPIKGEKIKLLNGKTIEPHQKAIMIATDKELIGLGGVMGGHDTEVDVHTKNIIIECANFNLYSIRRTSMIHGIFTDAVTRFSKGQSVHQNIPVLAKIVDDIKNKTGAKVSSRLFDVKQKLPDNPKITTSAEFINSRLGLKLSSKEIEKLLTNVEFEVESKKDNIEITAPFWRTDIEIAEDIVEEIGRLYGYDNLHLQLPKISLSPAIIDDELLLKRKIRQQLSSTGANELMTYSFIKGDLLETVGQNKKNAYKIKNALSPDLEYFRMSLTPSLLSKVHQNIKLGFSEFALYELGRVHIKGKEEDGLPKEFARLSLITASSKSSSTNPQFFVAKNYLIDLITSLGFDGETITFEEFSDDSDPAAVYYDKNRRAEVRISGELIGRIGEYKYSVSSKLKLPDACAGFEISLEPLMKLKTKIFYKPLSKFPDVIQDITLKTKYDLAHQQIHDAIMKYTSEFVPKDVKFSILPLDIFAKDENYKNTTFRIVFNSLKRTLEMKTVNQVMDKVAVQLKATIDADRV